jgi:pantetheine-phosphate adenylyltransferase
MTTALYAGTFDPVTYGHLDVVRRAAALFDKVIVGVSVNPRKEPLFSQQERAEMLREACQQFPNVEVAVVPGLVVDFARTVKAAVIVRGLRAVSDFEFELQMASTNRALAPEVETVFFTPAPQYHYLSASIVAEIARFGGNVSEFVPPHVVLRLKERLAERFGQATTAGSGPAQAKPRGGRRRDPHRNPEAAGRAGADRRRGPSAVSAPRLGV